MLPNWGKFLATTCLSKVSSVSLFQVLELYSDWFFLIPKSQFFVVRWQRSTKFNTLLHSKSQIYNDESWAEQPELSAVLLTLAIFIPLSSSLFSISVSCSNVGINVHTKRRKTSQNNLCFCTFVTAHYYYFQNMYIDFTTLEYLSVTENRNI